MIFNALLITGALFLALPPPGRAADLPELKLPYGTWRARHYNAEADVSSIKHSSCELCPPCLKLSLTFHLEKFYTFRNVRYAAPPVGSLRFARPQPPQPVQGIQDGSIGNVCPQDLGSQPSGNVTQGEGTWSTYSKRKACDDLT